MSKPEIVTLTRRAIAHGTLNTAILLWFLDKDPVSIHLLAVAALEVLDGAGRKKGVRSLIFEEFLEKRPKTKTEKRNLWDAVMLAENFFKHATKDPNHVLDFIPQVTDKFLFDAIRCYVMIYDVLTPTMRLFGRRYLVFDGSPTDVLPEFKKFLNEPFTPEEILALSRSEHLSRGLDWFRTQTRSAE